MTGLVLGIFWLFVRILLSLVFYATPLLGIWLASSLAAYLGGPQYLAWAAGLLLFPVLPGIWELHATSHRRSNSKPFLTTFDRLSLRTFAVGLAFLTVLLCLFPQTAFVSLSTRGDWMLDNVKGPNAASARRFLFAAASSVEWLYRATRTNPYIAQIDSKAQKISQEAAQEAAQEVEQRQETQDGNEKIAIQNENNTTQKIEQEIDPEQLFFRPTKVEIEKENPDKPEKKWPWRGSNTPHSAVTKMPAEVEISIQSVARYIANHEKDPVLRIKA